MSAQALLLLLFIASGILIAILYLRWLKYTPINLGGSQTDTEKKLFKILGYCTVIIAFLTPISIVFAYKDHILGLIGWIIALPIFIYLAPHLAKVFGPILKTESRLMVVIISFLIGLVFWSWIIAGDEVLKIFHSTKGE